jgi:hypothetical protein
MAKQSHACITWEYMTNAPENNGVSNLDSDKDGKGTTPPYLETDKGVLVTVRTMPNWVLGDS